MSASAKSVTRRACWPVSSLRNYVANLLAALGVHTRLQAVIAARKAGLIEP